MVYRNVHSTQSAHETQKLGEALADSVKRGESPRILCLYGELGSGKTTFAQGFARGLGLGSTRLLSPTFIIVRRYELPNSEHLFYHIDLYRLHEQHELETLGLDEIFSDQQNYVALEWPERLGTKMPAPSLNIRFASREDGTHEVIYE